MIEMMKQKVNTTGFKTVAVSRLPQVLCLNLTRGGYDYLSSSTEKIGLKVSFPIRLDMNKYMVSSHLVRKINGSRSVGVNQSKSTLLSPSLAPSLSCETDASLVITEKKKEKEKEKKEKKKKEEKEKKKKKESNRVTNEDKDEEGLSSPSKQCIADFSYRLKAVITHKGDSKGGHYSCYSFIDNNSHNSVPYSVPHNSPHALGGGHSSGGGGGVGIGGVGIGGVGVGGGGVGGNLSYWMVFSDAHYRKVTEAEVLSCEAFLLFYERDEEKEAEEDADDDEDEDEDEEEEEEGGGGEGRGGVPPIPLGL